MIINQKPLYMIAIPLSAFCYSTLTLPSQHGIKEAEKTVHNSHTYITMLLRQKQKAVELKLCDKAHYHAMHNILDPIIIRLKAAEQNLAQLHAQSNAHHQSNSLLHPIQRATQQVPLKVPPQTTGQDIAPQSSQLHENNQLPQPHSPSQPIKKDVGILSPPAKSQHSPSFTQQSKNSTQQRSQFCVQLPPLISTAGPFSYLAPAAPIRCIFNP